MLFSPRIPLSLIREVTETGELRVWQLARRKYAALDKEGVQRVGRRWNLPGRRVIPTVSSLVLAVLEVLVHLGLEVSGIYVFIHRPIAYNLGEILANQ